MSIKQAFEAFIKNTAAFQAAVDKSTKASWGGSGYSVELLDDGSHRILWNGDIGNLYDSPGLILAIPALAEDEWDEDPSIRFYDNAEQSLRDSFEEHYRANVELQATIAESLD